MKKEKVKYLKPEVELIQFEYDDVIATSGCNRDGCSTVEPVNVLV